MRQLIWQIHIEASNQDPQSISPVEFKLRRANRWSVRSGRSLRAKLASILPQMGALSRGSASKAGFSVRCKHLIAVARYATVNGSIPSGVEGAHMLTANYTW